MLSLQPNAEIIISIRSENSEFEIGETIWWIRYLSEESHQAKRNSWYAQTDALKHFCCSWDFQVSFWQ